VLRGKYIAISSSTKKWMISNTYLKMHLELLEKQEQAKHKISRWKEMINIRVEINEMVTKKVIQRINETKSWFFEKINKIDELLAKLTKKKGRRPK
jgi:hypothetical protein